MYKRQPRGVGAGQCRLKCRVVQGPGADGKFQPQVEQGGVDPAIEDVEDRIGHRGGRRFGLCHQFGGVLCLPARDQPGQKRLTIREMPVEAGARQAQPLGQHADLDLIDPAFDQHLIGRIQPKLGRAAPATFLAPFVNRMFHGATLGPSARIGNRLRKTRHTCRFLI